MRDLKYQHIIWDWNGTLLDDAGLCVAIMNDLLALRRLPALAPTTYEEIFDFPVVDYYRKVGFDFAIDPFEKLSDEFIGAYNRRVWACGLRDGAQAALAAGHQRGLTQSILSAMLQSTLDRLIAHFGLTHYFSAVTGLDNHHAAGKLALAQQWIAAQSTPRDTMLLIGDTVHDFEVAAALGIDCWLIHSGHHSRARLAALGAPIIESLAALYASER